MLSGKKAKREKITMESKKSTTGGIEYSDPAMVTVSFSRQTVGGRGTSLFGCSVKNHSVISLKVHPATVDRNLSQDWVHEQMIPIVEVLLSPNQFAELLTTMNSCPGTPGTLVLYNGERYETPEFPSKSEQFKNEAKANIEKAMKGLGETEDAITAMLDDPKPIGKAVRKQLRDMVRVYRRLLEDHVPFLMDQFARQMNKTVSEAKAEVDAFVTDMAIRTGLESLKKSAPQIEDKGE
jgi:hypothetical protein